jgi:uncharacterized protein YhfF
VTSVDQGQDLWNEFLASGEPEAESAADAPFTAWSFGDSPEMADRLLALVLEGRKRATCGSLEEYLAEGESPPVPGEYSVVLDGRGLGRCIIRTISVDIVPFDDVDAAFAREEGEGDRSLEYWRAGHWAYFDRELTARGSKPSGDMPLVCERFSLVFPSDPTSTLEELTCRNH